MADSGFQRPTLATLVDRVRSDINTRLEGADARLRRSKLSVLSAVLAGAAHLLYGYAAWIARQILPSTCDEVTLPRHGSLYQIDRRPPAPATGAWTVTGDEGAVIPAGWEILREDGARYLTDAEETIPVAGTLDVASTAVEAGEAGNADPGTKGRLASPIAGVNSEVVAAAEGFSGGLDEESAEDWRARILQRIQEPPQGGAASDYEQWTLAVPGVDRVWVYPVGLGAGTVLIRFTVEDTGAGVIPGAAKVTEVQTAIDALAPVTADVTVAAPAELALAHELAITPDTAEIRAAVEAELQVLYATEGAPGGTVYRNDIIGAVRNAKRAGLEQFTLVAPAADVTPAAHELPTLGTITWS